MYRQAEEAPQAKTWHAGKFFNVWVLDSADIRPSQSYMVLVELSPRVPSIASWALHLLAEVLLVNRPRSLQKHVNDRPLIDYVNVFRGHEISETDFCWANMRIRTPLPKLLYNMALQINGFNVSGISSAHILDEAQTYPRYHSLLEWA